MVSINENGADLTIDPKELPAGITVKKLIKYSKEGLEFTYNDQHAVVGIGTTSDSELPWATVYALTASAGMLHVRDSVHLMRALKKYFESRGYDFAYSSAETMLVQGVLYQASVRERERGIFKG